MTGAVRTADKLEEKLRVVDKAGPGESKHRYGKRHDISTEEGYYAGKIEHETEEAKKKAVADQADADAKAQAAQAASEAAALEKSQASQRAALKRKGRRASILTSAQGAADPLGVPGA